MVGDLVEQWLAVFSGPEQSIASWSLAIDHWLDGLYSQQRPQLHDVSIQTGKDARRFQPSDITNRTSMALESVRRVVGRFAELNDHLDLNVGGGAAIEMLAGRLADVRVVDAPSLRMWRFSAGSISLLMMHRPWS